MCTECVEKLRKLMASSIAFDMLPVFKSVASLALYAKGLVDPGIRRTGPEIESVGSRMVR
jgi:hypothetical protein